jgi:hypothetical protein
VAIAQVLLEGWTHVERQADWLTNYSFTAKSTENTKIFFFAVLALVAVRKDLSVNQERRGHGWKINPSSYDAQTGRWPGLTTCQLSPVSTSMAQTESVISGPLRGSLWKRR